MKKNNNKKSLFWISYSDLMTSLFFTMLVLFVVVVVKMGQTNAELLENKQQLISQRDSAIADKEKLEAVMRLNKQFQPLRESPYLEYDTTKCVFYVKDLMNKEIFPSKSDVIVDSLLPIVDEVGKEIKAIIDNLNKNNDDFKFQLVIEGTRAIPDGSRDTYNPDNEDEYVESYKRSLALYLRWKEKGLNFRDGNTEIIIAGSGFNGENRETERGKEGNNKRFVIQIIPKIKMFENK